MRHTAFVVEMSARAARRKERNEKLLINKQLDDDDDEVLILRGIYFGGSKIRERT